MKNSPIPQYASLAQKAIGACALASTLLFAAQASAQIVNYTWTGASSNTWAISGNWTKDGTGTHPGSQTQNTTANTTATVNGALISGGAATVNITSQVLFTGDSIAGTYDSLRLINNTTVNSTSQLRVASNAGVIRNVLIDSTSKLISTAATNGIQVGSNSNTLSTWTIQGQVEAVTLISSQAATETGGFVMNIDGGSLNVSSATNMRFSGDTSATATGIFNISNNGFLNLGAITNLGHSPNYYIDFVDGSGEFNFLRGSSYGSLALVEDLISTGKIRLRGSIVDKSAFDITDVGGTGWQIVAAVPEPSTYALLAGAGVLGAVLALRRRRS